MLLPFAEWRPDVAMLNSQYAADVKNVLCASASYVPFRTFLAGGGSALSTAPISGFTARRGPQYYMFMGTSAKLFMNDGSGTWNDVTKTATSYAATATARWDFAQFGNYVIAVNPNNKPQVYELGVSTRFTDLGGNPPQAKAVEVWGDFLALLGVTPNNMNRVHWSALNDITGWTAGTNNSDYQDFPDGGEVMGSSSSTNPTIILENAIYMGAFVPGSTEVFTFRKVHEKVGALSPYSIASRGALTFFLNGNGSFVIAPDGALRQIGLERVDRSVFSVPDGALTREQQRRATGIVDTSFSRVYWAVDKGANSRFTDLYIYDWDLDKWTRAAIDHAVLFATVPLGFASSPSAMTLGAMRFTSGFGYHHGTFDGSTLAEATLETAEFGDTAGGVTRITEWQPVVDASDLSELTITVGSRMRRSDAVTWGTGFSPSSNTGIARKRSRARYHSVRLTIASDPNLEWTHAQGVDINPSSAGRR